MITHYIPQWFLPRFGSPLYELDIHTANTERRAIIHAASDDDLWPKDIEDKVMGPHDNDAARVFRYSLKNYHRRIILTEAEKWTLSLWFALFLARVPAARQRLKTRVDKTTVDDSVKALRKKPKELMGLLKIRNPILYFHAVGNFGQEAGEIWLMDFLESQVRSGLIAPKFTVEEVYNYRLRNLDLNLNEWAQLIHERHWTFLYSPHGFVIGDNPLLRFNERTQAWDVGVARDIEFTMPLSTHLCLRMRRQKIIENGHVMYCPRALAAEYNRRQRLAAEAHLYGRDDLLLQFAIANVKPAKRRRHTHS